MRPSTALFTTVRRAALALLLAIVPAAADGTLATRTLTAADKDRLAAYAAVRKEAISNARDRSPLADVTTLDHVLGGKPLKITGPDLFGSYRCRTIKLGGALPLVIYGWFTCKIDEDGIGYRIVKTTGSQRLSGHFIDERPDRLIYYGALHFGEEALGRYGRDPERNQVGYLVKVSPNRFRLELPLPKQESRFDIVELMRR